MSHILLLPFFKRKIKKALKKHHSLKKDFYKHAQTFLESKEKNRWKADMGLYKVRVPISSEKIGKSGEYRTLLLFAKEDLFIPVSLYFKGDTEILSRQEIKRDLIQASLELEEWKKSNV